jgi:hypothetical protein
MLDELAGERGADEQPAEPFGSSAVKAAVAEGSLAKVALEIAVEPVDQLARDEVRDHAPAFAKQL